MDQKTTSEIIDVDGYVHVICGKVICFTKAVYDLSIQSDRELLLQFAQRLGTDPTIPAIFGENTVFELYPPHRSDSRCTLYYSNINSMKSELQTVVKKILNTRR